MTQETTQAVEVEETPVAPATETQQETPVTGENVEITPIEGSEEATTSEEDAQKEEAHKKGGVQKRIDELTRQRYEAQQRADTAELRERQIRQQAFQQSYEGSKPTLEQYDYDQDRWAGAYEDWVKIGNERAYQENQRAAQQASQTQQQAKRSQRMQEKALEAQAKYPDFIQRINDPSLPNLQEISPAAFEAVVESDAMGDLAYYMASNPQEVYRLGQLSPVAAIKEVARLEVRIAAKPVATGKPPPAPPSELKSRNEAGVDPNKMEINDWMKWRNAQANR